MKRVFDEDSAKVSNLCPFSRQIEVYCESVGKKDPPDFLTEHYENCEKCRPYFIKYGNELERLESLIPKVLKEDIIEAEINILKIWNQFRRKKSIFSFD